MPRLNKHKQAVWDRLNYVPHNGGLGIHYVDVNSIYASTMQKAIDNIILINRVSGDDESVKTFKVLKNR